MRTSTLTRVSSMLAIGAVLAFAPAAGEAAEPCIGASLPITGPTARAAESIRMGAETAIDEINAKGGVLGQELRFIQYDDAGQPPRGVDNARRIAESDNCIAMLGGWHSGVASAVVEPVHESGMPYIAVISAGTRITENDRDPNYGSWPKRSPEADPLMALPTEPSQAGVPALQASGLTIRFSGLTAVDAVGVTVTRATVHAIIGPNGAGKTTFLNAASGFYQPTEGTIRLDDQAIGGKRSDLIAKAGLTRTFQNTELFSDMTVAENILVGLDTRSHTGLVGTVLHLPGYLKEEQAMRERADHLLDYVGLGSYAGETAKNLPFTGEPAFAMVRRGLAMVREGRQVFADQTVEDNLLLGGYARSQESATKTARLARAYRLFPRLGERRSQLAGSLSGGEQQMPAIARGLQSEPELLVIDELSLGLAPKILDMLFPVLVELDAQGLAILLVEQLAGQALAISSRAYVLENGHVIASGASADLARDARVMEAYLGRRSAA